MPVVCRGDLKGVALIDSTPLRAGHNNLRLSNHQRKILLNAAKLLSVDWFYGFKLHLVIDDLGNLVVFVATPGNVDDRKSFGSFLRSKPRIIGIIIRLLMNLNRI